MTGMEGWIWLRCDLIDRWGYRSEGKMDGRKKRGREGGATYDTKV